MARGRPTNEQHVIQDALHKEGKSECTSCKVVLPISSFGLNSSARHQHQPKCRPCYNRHYKENIYPYADRTKSNARNLIWQRNHRKPSTPESRRKDRNRSKDTHARSYGFASNKERLEFLSKGCEICGRDADHVDHDHKTGKTRGALCRSCNVGLGFYKDSTHLLREAIRYLERTSQPPLT